MEDATVLKREEVTPVAAATPPVTASINEGPPPPKRIKIENDGDPSAVAATATATDVPVAQTQIQAQASSYSPDTIAPSGGGDSVQSAPAPSPQQRQQPCSSIVTASPGGTMSASASYSSSNTSLHDTNERTQAPQTAAPAVPVPAPSAPKSTSASVSSAPLKSTTMAHLHFKYTGELEYMLREFRKLERQLLGAKGASQIEESAGSRERREKLHSFILHLEDTIRQIELGCQLEEQGKTTVGVGVMTTSSGGSTSGDGADTTTVGATPKQDDCPEQVTASNPSALVNMTQEKEEEENVQKLEEHILANLLPVKVRLKKQLAAQQGATRNPVGMPPRVNMDQQQPRGVGTFAAAAEQRRKEAAEAAAAAAAAEEAAAAAARRRASDPTQFGKPLGSGGSSLTQKLHGATLGSKSRIHGHGVGIQSSQEATTAVSVAQATPERKILYAGMVPGSSQHESGIATASGAHEMVFEESSALRNAATKAPEPVLAPEPETATTAVAVAEAPSEVIVTAPTPVSATTEPAPKATKSAVTTFSLKAAAASAEKTEPITRDMVNDPNLTDDERKNLRKERRKRKFLRIIKQRDRDLKHLVALQQQNQSQVSQSSTPSKLCLLSPKHTLLKHPSEKKGPRTVEYICSLCSEAYNSTCEFNPWWALVQHECPKCRKLQVPRIDITAPANVIEYHPALLAHIDDNSGSSNAATLNVAPATRTVLPETFSAINATSGSTGATAELLVDPDDMSDSDSDSDLSDLSDGEEEDDPVDLTAADRAEHERFGHEYRGPEFSRDHAARLLVLMGHASTCPCRHKSAKHREVCMSTKFMMLHVRDCPGTTASSDVCPFPWCRKTKHLLYHLVTCQNPTDCNICSPTDLSPNMQSLVGLNEHRFPAFREKILASIAASKKTSAKSKTAPKTTPPTPKPVTTAAPTATAISSARKATAATTTTPTKSTPTTTTTTIRPPPVTTVAVKTEPAIGSCAQHPIKVDAANKVSSVDAVEVGC